MEKIKLLRSLDPNDKRVYVAFASSVEMSCPQADPFNGLPRDQAETDQVYFSEVSMRYHIRRTIEDLRRTGNYPLKHAELLAGATRAVRRFAHDGTPLSNTNVVDDIRKQQGIPADVPDAELLMQYALDPMYFGLVYAKKVGKGESSESAHFLPTVGRIGNHATVHRAHLITLGFNNAFCKDGKNMSGSHCETLVAYGLLTSMWEIHVESLLEAAERNQILTATNEKDRLQDLVELFCSALWHAYGVNRVISKSQRNQSSVYMRAWGGEPVMFAPELTVPNWFYNRIVNQAGFSPEVKTLQQYVEVKRLFLGSVDDYEKETGLKKLPLLYTSH